MSLPAARRRARLTRAEAKDLDFDWSMVRGVFRLAKPWRGSLALFALTSAATAIVGVAPPIVFKSIIDDAIPNRDVSHLALLALAAVALYVAQSASRLAQRWASARVGSGITFTMRVRLYDHVQRLPTSFFTATQAGALMSRINNDVMGAQRVLTDIVSTMTTNAFAFISTVTVMFALDWQLTLVVLAAVPFFLVPAKYMGRVLQAISRERMDLLADMNAHLQERLNVSGAMLNHLYGDPHREQVEYERRAANVRDVGVRTAVVSGGFALATSMFATCSTAIVYWVGGWRAIAGGLTVGTVVAFGQLASRAYQPVSSLSTTRLDLMTAMVSFERVFEVLDFPNPVTERPDAIELEHPRGDVTFEHVSYAYPPPSSATLASLENPEAAAVRALRNGARRGPPDRTRDPTAAAVLHDVSFVAPAGAMVALVGATGAGKSTALSLVPRLADVTGGAVQVDGVDVRHVTLASLRRAIGVVSQDTHLFHDTLRNNLLYAKPAASAEELERACRIARIHDLITSLPEGYETIAGDRGHRMSGGEKQRLAIARMILKDPRIVILDEATSHLDSHNERLIQEALDDALAGRTTLVIAHRLSTVVHADTIVVLDRGRVVQTGAHSELVTVPGPYRTLYETQYTAAADV